MLPERTVLVAVIDLFDPGPQPGVQIAQFAQVGCVEFGEELFA